MKKRAFLIFIVATFAFILTISVFVCSPEVAFADTGTDYSSYTSITNFVINTQADFESFATKYNANATYNFNGKSVTLNCDIDLAHSPMYFISFLGNFQGNGHKIYNQTKSLFGSIGTKTIAPLISSIDFVNAQNTDTFVLGDTNYGIISNINFWGNFALIANNFSGLIRSNFGTIQNCNNFATINAVRTAKISGITENNYGTLSNCHFLGDINFSLYVNSACYIALIAYNNYIENNTVVPAIPSAGLIDNCSSYANIVFTEVSASNNAPIVRLLFDNRGTINNTNIVVNVEKDITTVIDEGFVQYNLAGGSVTYCYYAYKDSFGFYDASGTLTNFASDWDTYLIESNLGTQFYFYDASYPVNKALFASDGASALNALTIAKASDIYKLRVFYGTDNIYAVMNTDCNLKKLPIVTRLGGSLSNINFDGDNFAFYLASIPYIFDQTFDISCINLGILATSSVISVSQNVSDDASIYYDDSAFNYGYSGGTQTSITPSISVGGLGTKVAPYLITTKEDLAYLNNIEGYALLTCDIVINKPLSADNYLPLTNLRATLFGGGHSIIGIVNQNFTVNNYQTISDVFFRGYINSTATSLVCENNYGQIANVKISGTVSIDNGCLVANNNNLTITDTVTFGTVSGNNVSGISTNNVGTINKVKNFASMNALSGNSSGIAYQNTGSISLSQNFGSADYGITANQQGAISNTINFALSNFADTNVAVLSSINKNLTNFSLINKGVANNYLKLDYLTMKDNIDYNLTTIFGYEVNTFYDYPTLRETGKKYKTALASPFKTYSFNNKTYADNLSYSIESIEAYIKTSETASASFAWKYNGEPFLGVNLKNAGTYIMTATYLGDINYLPAKSVQTFVIKKALPPVALEYNNFADINATYNGLMLSIVTEEPTNKAQLDSYGYVFSTSFSKGMVAVAPNEIIKPGVYKQTITYNNINYFELTATRNITIAKANMLLTINDYQINYLESFSWDSITVSLGGLVSTDIGKTVDMLIDNYSSYFTTNFVANSNVGQYNLGFNLNTIECYNITVTAGKLTVKAIDLLQGTISFYNATKGVNGSAENFYNGQIQALVATNLGSGVSVQYQNNQNKDAGYYFPKAIFSKANYNDLELTVYYEIKKIPLTITANNQTKNYGYALDTTTFTSIATGLASGDTMQNVFVERPFSYKVYQNLTLKQQNDVLDAGDYSIELTIGGADAINYNVDIVFGTLNVNKVNLKYFYNNNVQGESSSFDNHTYVYSGEQYSREINYFATNNIDVNITYKYYLNESLLPNNYATEANTYTIVATVTPLGQTVVNFVTTIYNCTMTIDKKPLSIAFSQNEYIFTYASLDYGVKENFAYNGFLPEGTLPTFACKKAGVSNAGREIGDYNLSYSVATSDNYYGHTAFATLRILPKQISVMIAANYTFSNSAITIGAVISGVLNDEINYSNLVFTYKNASNNTITAITAVGSYTVNIALSGNSNYALATSQHPVTVSPYNIYFEWGTLDYVYGTTGEITYLTRNYLIGATKVTLRNFFVSELNTNIDIGINFNSDISGLYILDESNIIKPANYNIYFTENSKDNNLNKINISKRELSVLWKLDNTAIFSQNYTGSYTGLSQESRWSYSLDNFAFSDGIDSVNIDKQVLGDANVIYHVGDYTILLTILNNLNYVLTNNFVNVKIVKADLTITINDATIEQGESYNSPSITVSGRRGDDVSKRAESLDLANIIMITDYVTTAPVGSKYSVNVVATFKNYQATVTRIGLLTVVANPYPDYDLSDVVYVYDGTNKTVTISGVASGITVNYSNNIHKDAGVYTASAVITYPSGRVKVSTCTITIIKATPTLNLTANSFIFTPNRLLLCSDIKGTAMHKGVRTQGTFQFVGEWYLLLGEYKLYEITFTPEDIQNYNIVNSFYTISSVEIDYSVLVFDNPLNFTFTSETSVDISAEVVITLKNVLNGLSLYRDGNKVEGIVLNKTENVNLQIRYNGDIVFGAEWDVNFIDTNAPNSLVINESLLELSGVSIKGDKLNVNALGGRIKLSPQYNDSYALYVNGIELDEYIVNGNEESLIIIIKSKAISNLTLFAKEYNIETVIIEEEVAKRDYSVYYITAGSVLGAALIIGLFIFIKKKKEIS